MESDLAAALAAVVPPSRLLTRPIERIAFASDASFYRLVPQAVVLAASIDEIRRLFAVSHAHRVPMTFRAAGTSLSGQAITDGILVEVARHWKTIAVEDEGRRVRAQPGAIGAHVNARLRPLGARIGPDPASINACTLGGILANNSSGMCCGVEQNAYHTLESVTFVLPSGTTIDTASPEADDEFREREPGIAAGLLALKREIDDHPALRDRIRAKYRIKNTTGYSLNALLDYDRPIDIMSHLLVGSEGTLGFIAEAVLRTVPDLPVKHTGLLLFADLHAACDAIVPLCDAGAKALELMDRASLRSVERQQGIPAIIRGLPDAAAGLLVELQAQAESARPEIAKLAADASADLPLIAPARFTDDPAEQAGLWRVRQGMFPAVGASRPTGTTVITEDVAFPVEALADAALDLTALFHRHDYPDAIIFGHAKDGNLHFVLSQAFTTPADVDQYARFMDAVVRLVVDRYDGSLKGEHGTGRNMAPFVEAEWGAEAAAIMRRLKNVIDPYGLLNPGVVLNEDPRAHLRDLKPLPPVEPEVDRCIECGYCDSRCPSRDLSLTPRQRIVVRREMARHAAGHERDPTLADLEAGFPWFALDTCATDGLCALACPVGIDTGQLVKRLRGERHGVAASEIAAWCAEHFDVVEAATRGALRAGHALQTIAGPTVVAGITRAARALVGNGVPLWSPETPRATASWRRVLDRLATSTVDRSHAYAVYFPTCLTRALGPARHEPGANALPEAMALVAARAGGAGYVPPDAPGTCCGVPFSSKGFRAAHSAAASRAVSRLWEWSHGGSLPIVVDASPCAYGLRTCREALPADVRTQFDRLQFLDSIEFVHDHLLPFLAPARVRRLVALHPVCSAIKLGLMEKLQAVSAACSAEVLVPEQAGCCGFAGDRGFITPELTASATRAEAGEVLAKPCDGYFSSSRTCEIGLSRATGRAYRSFVFLVDEATR